MPKLSIIVPVYNVEKYLCKCLDSVIYPQLSEYEIVIVNDGSTDSSPAIAEEYCRRFPDLCRMISTPNGGLGHARNVGLDNATGEYILFLDSDDYLADKALPEMLEAIDGSFDICFFDMISVNEEGRCLKYTEGYSKLGEISLEADPSLLFTPNAAWNKLFSRRLFERSGVRFPSRVWYEDLRTVPKLYFHAEKCISVRKPWYNYLQRSGSITNSSDAQRNMEIIPALDNLIAYCRKIGVFERYRNELEFMSLIHQLIFSTVRINHIDHKSPLQAELATDLFFKFPKCLENPYISQLSANRRIVLFLASHKMYFTLNIMMRLNNFIRRKDI